LGEFERRYPIGDMLEKDAITLFRIISRERGRTDLLQLSNETITELVKRVRCYPLLIKWSIGQVCLGKEIDQAFNQILFGESDISKFVFNDVFALLSENSKNILYGMIINGDKPVSKYILMHLADLSEEQFEDSIKELIMTSFVFSQNREEKSRIITEYTMLELTRGFINTKLDEDTKSREMLLTRNYHLAEQIQDFERSKSSYDQSLFTLGIKTTEEQIAFNYVKAAKRFWDQDENDKAVENFELALKIAPNLSYVLVEYSKFKFDKGHLPDALKLVQQAVNVNPESWHTWFTYGITLRKMNKFNEAVGVFEKAKELNPKHPPIQTELGGIYSYLGEYEKAHAEYTTALQEEKNPNFKHQLITLTRMAINYKRWAGSFGIRDDHSGEIKMLNEAINLLLKAEEIAPEDRRLCWNHLAVLTDLGIAQTRATCFKDGRVYLEKCLDPALINPQNSQFIEKNKNLDPNSVANACYFLAFFGLEEKQPNLSEIENWINQGITISTHTSIHNKLLTLKKRVTGDLQDPNRLEGAIMFFNFEKMLE
jgi:tetratricopeptide (TPR) repeat protein